MGVCLRHLKAIVRDRFSSLISSLYLVKIGGRRKNSPCNGLPYSWQTPWCKLQLFTTLRL